jgi:hypothetical protein
MERQRNATQPRSERPITKPVFPLPQDFENSDAPSNFPVGEVPLRNQRAYFFRKATTASGTPVYDFVITAEEQEAESH